MLSARTGIAKPTEKWTKLKAGTRRKERDRSRLNCWTIIRAITTLWEKPRARVCGHKARNRWTEESSWGGQEEKKSSVAMFIPMLVQTHVYIRICYHDYLAGRRVRETRSRNRNASARFVVIINSLARFPRLGDSGERNRVLLYSRARFARCM